MLSIRPITAAWHRLAQSFTQRGRALSERLQRYFLVSLVVRTVQEMSDDDATHMAAGVAYYAIFSLFPLLLGLIAILSFSGILESETAQARFTDFTSDYLPGSEELISTNIDSNVDTVLRLRGGLGIVSIIGLIWSGSAIFGALTRAVNRAWDVHKDRPLFKSKPRQMAMAMAVGVLFLLSLSAAAFVRTAGRFEDSDLPGVGFLVNFGGQLILQGTAYLLTLITFLLIYKFMPNTKTYWRFIWPGAAFAAILFELAKNLFIFYLSRFASFEGVYGSLAPVIVLLLWAYVSSFILILGAELSSEYGRLRSGVERGVLLQSSRSSVESSPE